MADSARNPMPRNSLPVTINSVDTTGNVMAITPAINLYCIEEPNRLSKLLHAGPSSRLVPINEHERPPAIGDENRAAGVETTIR
ncbi:unnamed protein product [Macrosiphum euphorbiae]|uniref:Uncharacterized protein n=1 Tax=Macrosiphum euphorbiae TaxID=13131 RepID=A0AAV0XBD5_9HEMI|nr:unnamed protein product [Macrosiphum euphorbiae]